MSLSAAYDYIIVGAGSAGCVLAARLSEDPGRRVLLLESGPKASHPFIRMPKGFAKLIGDPRFSWSFPVSHSPGGPAREERWPRGRMLGGTSSINGSLYTRGDPAEYDHWERMGCEGWGWRNMHEAFRALEDHEIEGGDRGHGGPLHISPQRERHPACDAFIQAGELLGLPHKDDLNDGDLEGVGYYPRTIRAGRRFSAVDAFLRKAINRRNLTVVTDIDVCRLMIEQRRAHGVVCRHRDSEITFIAEREVLLCAGAFNSPKLLQLSGIGPADVLRTAGVEVVLDRPEVGRRLREHRAIFMQFRVKDRSLSRNHGLRGPGLLTSVVEYALLGRGVLSLGAFEAGAFLKTRADLDRCDAQFLFSPISFDPERAREPERLPGIQCICVPVRPTSEGIVEILSAAPDTPPSIQPRSLSTPDDRATLVASVRSCRRLFQQSPLKDLVLEELALGPHIQTDDEILDIADRSANAGFHAIGTCRMGADDSSVTDPRLRVRGIGGLRVVDASVMPTLASANTNGPIMAMAWRAADLIRENER